MEKLLTVAETAKALGISKIALYKWIKKGIFPYIRIGEKLIKIREKDVEKWLDDNLVEPTTKNKR